MFVFDIVKSTNTQDRICRCYSREIAHTISFALNCPHCDGSETIGQMLADTPVLGVRVSILPIKLED